MYDKLYYTPYAVELQVFTLQLLHNYTPIKTILFVNQSMTAIK